MALANFLTIWDDFINIIKYNCRCALIFCLLIYMQISIVYLVEKADLLCGFVLFVMQSLNKALLSIMGKSNLRFAGMSIAVNISIEGLSLLIPTTRQVRLFQIIKTESNYLIRDSCSGGIHHCSQNSCHY